MAGNVRLFKGDHTECTSLGVANLGELSRHKTIFSAKHYYSKSANTQHFILLNAGEVSVTFSLFFWIVLFSNTSIRRV